MLLTLNLLTLRLAVGCQVWTVWQPGSSDFSTDFASRLVPVYAIAMRATALFAVAISHPIHDYKRHRSKRSC